MKSVKSTNRTDSQPFDPLAVENIGVTLAIELLEQPLQQLPPAEPFSGAGVYALYYKGSHPAYVDFCRYDDGKYRYPLYVGKAVRESAKQGFNPRPTRKTRIYDRLKNHAESIDGIGGLHARDFRCRYLTLQDAYISLAEAVLITTFRPAWNGLGVGSKVVGGPRMAGRPSLWDSLHPGRAGRPAGTRERQLEAKRKIAESLSALQSSPADPITAKMLAKIGKFF